MTEEDVTYLAVPLDANAPFPLMPAFCFGRIRVISGREHVVFGVRNGKLII